MDLTKELPYAVEESINRLRINVSFLGNEIKKIMVVSTMPNEGKSFVTLQMWKQMASAGIKSVFVDGDMRNSVIVNKYGIEKEDGSEIWQKNFHLKMLYIIHHLKMEILYQTWKI